MRPVMRKLLLVVIVAASLVAPRLADALVMCGSKKPDGALREGASIKLRTTCRSNELQVDPVALGLQGPAGPTGPIGPTGEGGPAGPPGTNGGVAARDANGALIGPVASGVEANTGGGSSSYQAVVVSSTEVLGVSRLVWAQVQPAGFAWQFTDPDGTTSALLYASAGCAGTAYVHANNADREMMYRGVVVGPFATLPPLNGLGMSGPGTTLYYPSGATTKINVVSYAMSYPGGNPCVGGVGPGFPISTDVCCYTGSINDVWVAPAAEADLSAFVPPFTFVVN